MSEVIDGEVVNGLPALAQASPLAISLARAEIDQQISTAHAYPRSIDRAVKNSLTLATMDEQAAEECIYALPRGGKPIKGASVRLAEIVASQWGNNRVGARVVHVDRDEKFVEAEGVYHDLETNAAITSRVRRRIVDAKGRLFSDDMIIVTGNAAAAIAKRNAILGGVPRAVWRKAYEAAEKVIVGDVKTLSVRREGAIRAFAAFGVTPAQIFTALGVSGLDDIGLSHIPELIGMHSALKSGEVEVEEMFPAGDPKPKPPTPPASDGPKEPARRPPKPPAQKAEKAAPPPPDTVPGPQVIPEREREPEPADDVPHAYDEPGEVVLADPLLDAAREKAMEGARPLRFWLGKLEQSQLDQLQAHMPELQKAARAADALEAP
jgi:hypothetical protein